MRHGSVIFDQQVEGQRIVAENEPPFVDYGVQAIDRFLDVFTIYRNALDIQFCVIGLCASVVQVHGVFFGIIIAMGILLIDKTIKIIIAILIGSGSEHSHRWSMATKLEAVHTLAKFDRVEFIRLEFGVFKGVVMAFQ